MPYGLKYLCEKKKEKKEREREIKNKKEDGRPLVDFDQKNTGISNKFQANLGVLMKLQVMKC